MEDLVLIEELARGNERALKEIFLRFNRPMLLFVIQLTKNREIAEEIVADSFMKIWDMREKFSSIDKLRSFLYVVNRNACFNYLKTSERRLFVEEGLDCAEELRHEDPDILHKIILSELLHNLFEQAAKMPKKQRAVFELLFRKHYTIEEICQKLGVNSSSVYTHRSRAISYLKTYLDKTTLILLLQVFL